MPVYDKFFLQPLSSNNHLFSRPLICLFFLSRDKSQKQSGIKNQDKQSGSVSVNPPSKENSATSARYYLQHRLLKIVVQTDALLPQSEPGVSNYPFCLKMQPGPNMVLFFIL